MQVHQLKPINKQKSKKRVGRGGAHGTFSGHGVKGQKSRAGAKIRPAWRDLVKQIPKRRGYRFNPNTDKPRVINLNAISNSFKENEVVSFETLLQKGLISKIKGKMPPVKILGGGELVKKLDFKGLEMSGSVREKIKKAGGLIQ